MIRISLGQIGVVVFFISGGFFYKKDGHDGKTFWKKKLTTVIAPWLVLATGTYALSVVLSNTASGLPLSYVKWVLGIGTCYWYMPVLIICYALFNCICGLQKHVEKVALFACVAVSILSVLLSICSVIKYNLEFNQYTNVFNWIGVFSIGILIRKKGVIEKLCSIKWMLRALPMLGIFVVLSANRRVLIQAYIDIYSLPIEIVGCVFVFGAANILRGSKLLIDMGKKSFFVYLMHIQVAGMITTRLPYNTVFFILRPVIAVITCYIIAKIIECVLIKLKCLDQVGHFLALR